MTTLKFADTHNMVAFLSKPAESDGFEQIVDFLNAQPIRYALTVNPTIYISLALNNSGLLAWSKLSMGNSKTTAWNEFSSTMASVIICLATNQKFNFSKFIFEGMIRNLDNVSGKFFMYPRFIQEFLNQQLDGLPTHNRIYVAPSHTKKIFANMRRVGKGFSGRVTPLFPTMVVQNQSQMGEGSTIPTDPHHTPTFIQPSPQPQKTQKPRKPKRKDTQVPQPSDPSENVADEAVHKELGDSGGPRCQETIGILLLKLGGSGSLKRKEVQELMGRKDKKMKTYPGLMFKIGEEMFDVDALDGEEVFVTGQNENVVEEVVDATQVSTAATTVTITTKEITLAQAHTTLKTSKPKDTGKGIMIEEPMKPMKKKVQIMLNEEAALNIQAGFDEEEKLAREKDKANVALIEEWDDIQAKIEADHELAQRLKHFAAKSAEEKRNKPPTQAQQREIICTYLKNMERKKLKDLKNKSFDSIQKMLDKAYNRVNTFVDFRTDLVEGSLKRAGDELEQEFKEAKGDIVKSVSTTVHFGTTGVSSVAGNVIAIEHIFSLQALVDDILIQLP
ncbi:hypothetical protein Tco_0488059 [Tanacetum coccineum]